MQLFKILDRLTILASPSEPVEYDYECKVRHVKKKELNDLCHIQLKHALIPNVGYCSNYLFESCAGTACHFMPCTKIKIPLFSLCCDRCTADDFGMMINGITLANGCGIVCFKNTTS